jgi:hypothetical protein
VGLFGAILGQQRVQIIQNNSTVLQLDCSVSETHTRESPPTEFPVENGDTISDHIIIKPFELELQGIISDTPIGGIGGLLTEAATTLTSALLPPSGLITAAAGVAIFSALTGAKSPSVAAFTQLIQLQQLAQPLTVLTSLNRYTNMWIKSISIPRDSNTGKILLFNVHFRQLLIVAPQSVNVAVFANPGLSAAQANTGEQGPQLSQQYQAGFNNATAAVHQVVGNNGIVGGP